MGKSLVSMAEIAKLSGRPRSTLYRWKRNRPDLFEIVVRGCMEIKVGELKESTLRELI